jgi:WD40 repeat protein
MKGRDYLMCKMLLSYHKRDVTCVDVTSKYSLVTGSIDNLICFWDIFNCRINKWKSLPDKLVPHSFSNSICGLFFADKDSNELLLVFMNRGEVYCLDTVKEEFVLQKQGSYQLANIKKFSIVDVK